MRQVMRFIGLPFRLAISIPLVLTGLLIAILDPDIIDHFFGDMWEWVWEGRS